ncbi:hypothetical protein QQF64_034521, partial [Cirrhinus molitorella]
VQLLFTWNPSPLRPSKLSFEYLLLPPRSAPAAAPPGPAPLGFSATAAALLLVEAYLFSERPRFCRRRPGIGPTLQRHPFSGLV